MPAMGDTKRQLRPGEEPRAKILGDGAIDPHCDDACFAILFVLQAVAVIFFAFTFFASDESSLVLAPLAEAIEASGLNRAGFVGSIALSIGLALLSSLAWIKLWMETLERFAKSLIVLLNVFLPVACLIIAAQLASMGVAECNGEMCTSFVLAAAFGVAAIVQLLWLCCVWARIELTAQILADVSSVLTDMPGSIAISFGAVGVMLIWSILAIAANVGALDMFSAYAAEQEMTSTGAANGKFWISLVLVLCFYWGNETFRMISHVTTCGTVASWYFFPHVLTQGTPGCRPATCDSLRRACTSAFGSIAFGALVLAIFDLIQYLVHKAFDSLEGVSDNALVKCIRCCVEACLQAVKSCMEWLTDYAFVYIAIYGISFVEAGLAVKDLVRTAGLDAIAQTTLLGPILLMGKAIGTLLGGAAAVFGATYIHPAPLASALTAGLVTGGIASTVGLTVIESGAKTLFVCYAEEPATMRSRKVDLADKLEMATKLKGPNQDSLVAP